MSKLYFGPDVDQALMLFKLETDSDKRNDIFLNDIKPAFEKLANYHFHKVSVSNPELVHDCLTYLYEKIENFDIENHKRGFPYFNMVARNYFYQKINSEKKELIEKQECANWNIPQKIESQEAEDLDEKIQFMEFFQLVKQHLPIWKDQFKKQQEKDFVDALISLLDNIDNLPIFNKKAIYIYLKEMTGMNVKQISSHFGKIKKKYSFLKRKYSRGEI